MNGPKLKDYRRRRDFSRTSEPRGRQTGETGNRFVVHKHAATADHYDLRLQLGDVLKCWAVPKGPSLDPQIKRLAVETEDHPLDYIDFEGVIPKGEYGGGAMIVWDAGTWAPMEDAEEGLTAGTLKFRLAGEKLSGGWMLTRLKPKKGEKKRNWLLIKERDQAADPDLDIVGERPESIRSGLTTEQLAERSQQDGERAPRPKRLAPGQLKGSKKAEMPKRLKPQLATAADKAPQGDDWLHEIKFDGYRTLAFLEDGKARLVTRSGLDWTKRYGDLAHAFEQLPCKQAVIDGEIVVTDDEGVSRFAALQQAISDGPGNKLVYYAFDLVHLNGWDLRAVELAKRKDMLERLLQGHAGGRSPIQLSDHVVGDGAQFYDKVSDLGLEGVVSKKASSSYQEGRSKTWLKIKALQAGDFVIAGYTTSQAAEGLAALALGEWHDGELHYRGKVGTGFDAPMLKDLIGRLEPLRDDGARLDGAPRDIHWVRPVLSAHIHFANRTSDGLLRHAVFKDVRDPALSASDSPERKRLVSDDDLASVWVTNPTRRLFTRSGPTKLDVAVYYASMGDFMLPHILERPVSFLRCPTGKRQDCFFQRHAFSGMPDSISTFETTDSDGEKQTYLVVDGVKGYLALAQFGVVEIHVWGTTARRLERPDRIVFDLDPGEGIAWREIVEAAQHIRGQLETLQLIPFVKTSGGKGLHVTVPIKPDSDWKTVHQRTGEIAAAIARTAPDTFTTTMGKEKRKGRIFIDFHRNVRGATAVAPYSLRARPNLPASTPITWNDLESIDAPEDLNYSSLPGLISTSGDPWAEIAESARDLPTAET